MSSTCLGTMMFGSWGNADERECLAIADAAFDAGVNFFDTADVYDAGRSEEILGRALRGRREDAVVATKVHFPMGPGPNEGGNSRRWIVRACEASLRRLGTEWIDLYQLHLPDPDTAVEETLAAMTDLVRAGKVLAVGTSNYPADELVDLQWTAADRRLVRPSTEQPPYSLLARGVERELFPALVRHGVAAVTYSPLCGGWLAGKYRADGVVPEGSRAATHPDHIDVGGPFHRQKAEVVGRLEAVARTAGLTLVELAVAFARSHPAVAATIVGPRRPDQARALFAAADVVLDHQTLDAIDEVVAPGETLNPADRGYARPALAPGARRRPQRR